MSRVSTRSRPSASATRGSTAIDLGKDRGVDLGRKTTPSATSGGLGVTTEVGSVAGVTVTGGVSVDISPIRLDVSGNVDYDDPSKNNISIAGGAEIPGGVVGVSGGVTINASSGEIEGGSVGAEVVGIGVDISVSKEGSLGVGISLQIPFTPIEISLGFGFPPKQPTPTPTPTPTPAPFDTENKGFGTDSSKWPSFKPNCYYTMLIMVLGKEGVATNCTGFQNVDGGFGYSFEEYGERDSYSQIITGVVYDNSARIWRLVVKEKPVLGQVFSIEASWLTVIEGNLLSQSDSPNGGKGVNLGESVATLGKHDFARRQGPGNSNWSVIFQQVLDFYNNGRSDYTSYKFIPLESCPNGVADTPIFNELLISPPPALIVSPFPNPPPRKESMDTCCQENLKFLRAIYKGLGIAKFPGKLPSTIIQTVPNEGEEPAEPPPVPIADFVDLLDWQFKRDDERWGQWEIQIDIKDSDITKEGDQEKQIKFPNLAESIAEIEGQILSLTANVDGLVAITTKNLVESGLGRQEAIKGYLASKAIIKYMAFKTTEIDVDIPACYTPGAESIDKLVEESVIHFKGIDYTDKETLRDIYLDLLQAAAIIRAVHWQPIDTKQDTKTQLLDLLRGSASLANSVKNPTVTAPDGTQTKPKDNFEDFIDTVEDGFRNTSGIVDAENPYGRTSDRRPIIRQIGDNISQAGDEN